MQIRRFGALDDDKSLRACHELYLSGQPDDDPDAPPMSPDMFRGWWGYGFSGDPQQAWLATADSGDPVGCYVLELPERENRENGFCVPVVGRGWRRQGVGTALLAHAARQAAAAGRKLLMSCARVGAPGEAFAVAAGARSGLCDVRQILDLDAGLPSRLAALRASALPHSDGYTLRSWAGLAPPDLIGQVCALYTALGDAPHDDVFEPASWDAERLSAAEERVVAQGTRWYSVAAMHEASGQMAGLTQLTVDPGVAGWAFQEITAVTRQHRGHRLGLLVKVAMLEQLTAREPGVRQVMTTNGAPNEHMIAVNAGLGYRVTDSFRSFELEVGAASALAAGR